MKTVITWMPHFRAVHRDMFLSLGLAQTFCQPLNQHYSTVLSRPLFKHTLALVDLNADYACHCECRRNCDGVRPGRSLQESANYPAAIGRGSCRCHGEDEGIRTQTRYSTGLRRLRNLQPINSKWKGIRSPLFLSSRLSDFDYLSVDFILETVMFSN